MTADEFLSMGQLVQIAQLYPASALPSGTHQSHPIPVLKEGGLEIAFLYCKAAVVEPQAGLNIWPPSYVAYLDAATGKFERLRATSPKNYRLSDSPESPLGTYLSPPERNTESFVTALGRLYQDYDALLPAFVAKPATIKPEITDHAVDFRRQFDVVVERPLIPYYRAVGREFMSWLAALSKSSTDRT